MTPNNIIAAAEGNLSRGVRPGSGGAWRWLLVLALGLAWRGPQAGWAAEGSGAVRERIGFDDGWRFARGDAPEVGHQLDYAQIKDWILPTSRGLTTNAAWQTLSLPPTNPAPAVAYAAPDFDDSQWRLLNLPHDWGIEGPFKQKYPGETGKLPWWGIGWYRHHLALGAAEAGKQVYLDVDGAMAYASVWVNGHLAGGWPYGYASWRVDLTAFVTFGGDNVIAIRLDNPPKSSRWYPGGGIYRNVWIVKTAPVHVAHWGAWVTTPAVGPKAATVRVQVAVENAGTNAAAVTVRNQIYQLTPDGCRGRAVSRLETSALEVPAGATVDCRQQGEIGSPRLWTLERPDRYEVVTTIEQAGRPLDEHTTPFGVRTTEFTVAGGFFLNGRHVKINGVCDHHDLGALGAAINRRALQRQLEILRSMGVNAIRTSHNPPAPELLDLCDQMGFLVMDEAFDCWVTGKNPNDYHVLYRDWHEQDLRALVRRDRNHPCVILWSSGNEVPDQDRADGPALAAENRAIIHEEDNTRPVTAAVSSYKAGFSGFETNFDVFGWNYKPRYYAQFRASNPGLPLFGSETASTVSSRGVYVFPVPALDAGRHNRETLLDYQVSSYDDYVPGWATLPDTEFQGEAENPFVAGEFVWTGFDYLGEPTPYNADASNLLNFSDPAERAAAREELTKLGRVPIPSRSSYFGIVDLAGFKKDRFYLYQSVWRPDDPMAHLLPHWTWPDRVGKITPVWVYTSGDAAELFLNGRSLGRRTKAPGEYRLCWNQVVYQPGVLKVVAYRHGRKWAVDEERTAGEPARVTLAVDQRKIRADGLDLACVTAKVTDQKGTMEPRADTLIHFTVEGPGVIAATDNGDATSFESFQSPDRHAFNGMALVMVRSLAGQPGAIRLRASAEGLAPAEVTIRSR